MINYIKEDLVEMEVPENSYKLHACNAQGVWGRGIALGFKQKYPKSFKEYKDYCREWFSVSLGKALITEENVICLITSHGYNPPDSQREILAATEHGLIQMVHSLPEDAKIYSNRFNSGLFKVSWEYTEQFIRQFLIRRPDVTWTVCDKD